VDDTIQLPPASPHAYLAWVAWWRDVEELLGSDLAMHAYRSAHGEGPSIGDGLESVIPAHLRAIEEEARQAMDEGRPEIAPKLSAPHERWREWMEYGRQRREWLEALALKGLPVPRFPEDLVILWQETLKTIQAQVSEDVSLGNLKILPDEEAGRFRLVGELEISNVEAAGRRLEDELRAGRRLRLDLSGVTFMDSKGLALLLRLRSLAEESGLAPVVVVSPSAIVRRVLRVAVPQEITGLEVRANQAT
jgi:anti-sigma B factor antagonist